MSDLFMRAALIFLAATLTEPFVPDRVFLMPDLWAYVLGFVLGSGLVLLAMLGQAVDVEAEHD